MTVYDGRSNDVYYVAGYDQQVLPEHVNEILDRLIGAHLDALQTEKGRAAGVRYRDCIGSGDFSSVYDYDPDVLDCGSNDFYHLKQCAAFFAKRRDINVGVDRKQVALSKFREAEDSCKMTNSVFLARSQGRLQLRPDVEQVVYAAQQKICALLAQDVPSWDELRIRFGPGATTQTPKKNACAAMKLQDTPAVASNTAHWASDMLACTGWAPESGILDVPIHASRISFVPKSLKSLRAICTEPALNSMYQLAVGDFLAEKLRRVGIDIRDQGANQRAAETGSIDGSLATIDLSMASDMVSWRLVEALFPRDWFDFLYTLSSRCAIIDGIETELHKLSTMGNGFTFPVETLVFWALAQACSDQLKVAKRALAYGDDIIVATEVVPLLSRVLHDCGFKVNMSKSFWTGPFRESCGKDYYLGIDVRPFFLKGFIPDRQDYGFIEGKDLFSLHNYYARKKLFGFARIVERFIHPAIRLRGPDGYGDGHLVSIYIPKIRCGKGCLGYTFRTFSFSVRSLKDEVVKRFTVNESHKDHVRKIREHGRNTKSATVFKRGRLAFVMRLACYTTYLREEHEDSLVDLQLRSDDMMWEVPGRGPLRITSVYTFEPAFLN